MATTSIRFCGFGGQGIILSAVLMGEAAVIGNGLFAAQTQSYGSEARGGQCQAELKISDAPILTPIQHKNDILIAMFQTAFNTYISSLREGGTLFVDAELVPKLENVPKNVKIHKIPATETAIELGNKMAANMVMLGAVAKATGLVTVEQLKETLKGALKASLLPLNYKALEKGASI